MGTKGPLEMLIWGSIVSSYKTRIHKGLMLEPPFLTYFVIKTTCIKIYNLTGLTSVPPTILAVLSTPHLRAKIYFLIESLQWLLPSFPKNKHVIKSVEIKIKLK